MYIDYKVLNEKLQLLKGIDYIPIFLLFVIGDCVTTFLMYNNIPGFVDLNPWIHLLHSQFTNNAIFYIAYVLVKILVLEVLYIILRFQAKRLMILSVLTYLMLLLMSLYIVINNLHILNIL